MVPALAVPRGESTIPESRLVAPRVSKADRIDLNQISRTQQDRGDRRAPA